MQKKNFKEIKNWPQFIMIRKLKFDYFDFVMISVLAVFLIGMTIDLSAGLSIDTHLMIITVPMLYFLLKFLPKFKLKFLDLYLIVAGAIVAMLLYYYLVMNFAIFPITLLVNNQETLLSFLILTGSLSSIKYCSEKSQFNSLLYGSLSIGCYFLMFIIKHVTSIAVLALALFFIPIICRPTVYLVKKNLQLIVAYFFILSNMSLITNFTTLIKYEVSYSLINSVWIDLFIAIALLFVFSYWDKKPKDIDVYKVTLNKVQKIYKMWVVFCGSILLIVMINIDNLMFVGPEILGESIIHILETFRFNMISSTNIIFQILRDCSLIEVITYIVFMVIFGYLIFSNKEKNETSSIMKIMFVVFVMQSIILPINALTFPVYIIIIIALFTNEWREKNCLAVE